MAREYIKVSKYYYIVLGSAVFLFLGYSLYDTFIVPLRYRVATHETRIKPLVITGKEGWGYLKSSKNYSKSTVFYKENRFISNTILISDSCREDKLSQFGIKRPTSTKSGNYSPFFLEDLDYPFQLSKEANSDTILVVKEDCILRFLMLEYDGPYK